MYLMVINMKIPKGKAPEGKYMFGTVKVGERGQIVIPKEARDIFDIKAGDSLVILGDEKQKGLAIMKNNLFLDLAFKALNGQDEEEEKQQ